MIQFIHVQLCNIEHARDSPQDAASMVSVEKGSERGAESTAD